MTLGRPARRATLASATLVLSMIGAASAVAASGTPSNDSPNAPTSIGGSFGGPKTHVTFKKAAGPTAQSRATVAETTPFDITSISVDDGALYPSSEYPELSPGFSPIFANVQYTYEGTEDQISSIKPLIGIDGHGRGPGLLLPDDAFPTTDFYLLTKNAYGIGEARLGSFVIKYTDGGTSTDTIKSNYFRIRLGTDGKFAAKYTGSTLKFVVYGYKYDVSKKKYVSLGSMFIQFASGDSWANLAKVKLDSSGRGTYSFKPRSEHSYRIYFPTTTTIQGGESDPSEPF